MNHIILRVMHKIGLSIPFVTIVTDLVSFHPAWIAPDVTLCIVPTQLAGKRAIELGMPPEKVVVCGQPIRTRFHHRIKNKQALRKRFDLMPDRPTVLIMAGAEGSARVFDLARSLAQTLDDSQIVIITGRNTATGVRAV